VVRELLEVQSVNDFHQGIESQSAIRPNGLDLNHGPTPARLTRPEAFSSIVYASRAISEIIDKIECARDISPQAGIHSLQLRRRGV
jgi:hypothetical protein